MQQLNRRIVVGLDEQGRSVVIKDARDMALAHPPTGVEIQEVWRQVRVPARLDDSGTRTAPIELEAPAGGAVIRILTVPPAPATWTLDLHFDDSMHVMTMMTGQLDVVLDHGTVTLQPGDSIVLPASMHDLHNTLDTPVTFIYTSFPLSRQE